jgi:hypothetical protein
MDVRHAPREIQEEAFRKGYPSDLFIGQTRLRNTLLLSVCYPAEGKTSELLNQHGPQKTIDKDGHDNVKQENEEERVSVCGGSSPCIGSIGENDPTLG